MVAKESNDSISNIYEQFLIYIYRKEDIINNKDLPKKLLSVKRIFIINQAKKEAIMLGQIKQIVDDHKTKIGKKAVWEKSHTTEIVKYRKKRLEMYQDFLTSIEDSDNNNKIIKELNSLINIYEDIIIRIKQEKDIDIYNNIKK